MRKLMSLTAAVVKTVVEMRERPVRKTIQSLSQEQANGIHVAVMLLYALSSFNDWR